MSDTTDTATKGLTLRLRPGDGNEVAILHGDDLKPILTIKGDDSSRLFMGRVDDFNRLVLINATQEQAKQKYDHKATKKDLPPGCTRSWKIEGDKMIIWNADGGEVALQIADQPGPATPDPEPEIFGQDELLFDLAMAIDTNSHALMVGPTGVGKTSILRWLAYKLNWNFVLMPISRGTTDPNMIGEYMPVGPAQFEWVDGPITHAVRLSQTHQTILVMDELNRIGNVAEYARIYSLLDGSRRLILSEKRNGKNSAEIVKSGKLFVVGTSNPVDDEGMAGGADYIGVQELDPALSSRFDYQPPVPYPPARIEAGALASRVDGLTLPMAIMMVDIANRIREAAEIKFPISFRDLMAWGKAIKYKGFTKAAETAVIRKAHPLYRTDIANIIELKAKDVVA